MKKCLYQYFSIMASLWNEFWYGEKNLKALAIFRIAIAAIFFSFFLSRIPDLELFYTNTGLIHSSNFMMDENLAHYHQSIFRYVDSLELVQALHALLLLSLFTLTIGYKTRLSSVLVYVLHLMFIQRNPGVQYGIDFIGTFYLFYLMFTKSNAYYSLDALLAQRKKRLMKKFRAPDLFSSVAIRFMQIQICIIYFYAGAAKLKGTRWWNGSAIWDVFSMEGLARWDLSFVVWIPDALVFLCYLVLLWEIYFPVLVWFQKSRIPIIIFGTLMHLGFAILINIPNFSIFMISIYILFLSNQNIESILAFCYKQYRRFLPA